MNRNDNMIQDAVREAMTFKVSLEDVLGYRWQYEGPPEVCGLGAVIPVTGLNIGFKGQVSRTGERVIAAREANANNTLNINFGDPVILQEDATGGTYTSVADWIENSSGIFVPNSNPVILPTNGAAFAGIAVREIKTNLTGYPYSGATPPTGSYAPGQMAEVLERGSITILLNVTTGAKAGSPVYVRILANASIPAGVVGGFEAQADSVSTTMTATSIGTTLTVASGTGTVNGQAVTGFGIAAGTVISSGGGTTTITINQNTTAIIAAGTPVTFGNTVMLNDTAFRTGVVDANNMAEVTILRRIAG